MTRKETQVILAIGNSKEYNFAEFQSVQQALRARGHEIILFKQDRCLEEDYLSFEARGREAHYTVTISGVDYDVDGFSAVYYMTPLLPDELLTYKPVEHRQLIYRQFRAMREGLWLLFRGKRWVNDPVAAEIAENKPYQLSIASQFFLLPDTLITSDPDRVRRFYEEHSRSIVTKLIAVSPIIDHMVYTNVVTEEHMEQIDTVKMAPSIFQSRVDKAFELRITVVGDKIFPAKLYSQEDRETAIDWRRKPTGDDYVVSMEPTKIPREIEDAIFSFMRRIDLSYGCIDMAVTPKGEYIFFEVNPGGQWYFAQLKTEMPIAEAVAGLLIKGNG